MTKLRQQVLGIKTRDMKLAGGIDLKQVGGYFRQRVCSVFRISPSLARRRPSVSSSMLTPDMNGPTGAAVSALDDFVLPLLVPLPAAAAAAGPGGPRNPRIRRSRHRSAVYGSRPRLHRGKGQFGLMVHTYLIQFLRPTSA